MKANESRKEGVLLILTEEFDRRVTINQPISSRVIHIRIEIEIIKLDIIQICAIMGEQKRVKWKSSLMIKIQYID